MDERTKLLAEAQKPFLKGDYEKAIIIYDEMLKIYPTDSKIFELKGLALSNLRLESTLASQPQKSVDFLLSRDQSNLNKSSILEFYKALEINPKKRFGLEWRRNGLWKFWRIFRSRTIF